MIVHHLMLFDVGGMEITVKQFLPHIGMGSVNRTNPASTDVGSGAAVSIDALHEQILWTGALL